MPRRPLHPCKQHGCPALTESRHCARHRKQADAADRERRGSAAQRGYDKDHRNWRLMVLDKDPLCVVCLKEGRVTPSLVADHVVPLSEGGGWELENGAGMCTSCHNRKTMRERAARRENNPRRVALSL